MNDLHKRAAKFLQSRFTKAPVLNQQRNIDVNSGELIKYFHPMIAFDPDAGIKQRLLAVPDFGSYGETEHFAKTVSDVIEDLDKSFWTSLGNSNLPEGSDINSDQMLFAPKIIIYTNKLCVPYVEALQAFKIYNHLIEIIDESEMHNTLFISYGGPDEEYVSHINKFLKSNGVKTWFFPSDALPGQKLHRVMHEGVNNYDKVLLVCSENSLSRPGVLNELERVLEKEAKEGGKEILIPITLDDYVYSAWAPDRPDLAEQVRSRVISKFPASLEMKGEFESVIQKLISAIKIRR